VMQTAARVARPLSQAPLLHLSFSLSAPPLLPVPHQQGHDAEGDGTSMPPPSPLSSSVAAPASSPVSSKQS
jgi:hypothetical protein